MPRVATSAAPKHWRVKFTRRGMEPPRPFGKTSAVVCAMSRAAAKEAVPASPMFPVTASETNEPVTWPNRCHHEDPAAPSEPAEQKSPAELDRDIAAYLQSDG